MGAADERPRFQASAALAVLLMWAASAAAWWTVATRLDAGAVDGVPGIIREAVRGGVITPSDAWASLMRRIAYAVGILALPWVFPSHWARRREIMQRLAGESTPETVAFLRIAVAAILLVSTFVEDVSSIARMPASAARPKGVILVLEALPGYQAFARNESALRVFAWMTRALLGMALVGWRGRVTVPAAAIAALVFGGLLRTYANSFHAGLLPIWLLFVLACYPTTDAWSLDARRWRARPALVRPPARLALYGWARYTFWGALALAYVGAGTSKLFNGGPLWWEPNNMRVILAMDGLNPMELPFRLGLSMATGPAWCLALLGLSAVAIELGMVSMLFSWRARWVMPAAMLATHVGIALLQNVLFADLIALLALFYAQAWTDRRSGCRSVYLGPAEEVVNTPPAEARERASRVGLRTFATFAGALVIANVGGVEFYPLTGMQMYSRRNHDGLVRYHRIVTVDAQGHARDAHPECWVWALRDSRFRFHLHRCFGEDQLTPCRDFLGGFARFVAASPTSVGVVAVEAQEWRWSIREHPSDAAHGTLHARVRVDLEGNVLATPSP